MVDVYAEENHDLRRLLRTAREELGVANGRIRDLVAEISRLQRALSIYTYCRHGCSECFCTTEARAALWTREGSNG